MASETRHGQLIIQADGAFQTTIEGQVVESGKMRAIDGRWTKKLSTGANQAGTFSMIGSKLIIRGGAAGTRYWRRVANAGVIKPVAGQPKASRSNYSQLTNNLSNYKTADSMPKKAPSYKALAGNINKSELQDTRSTYQRAPAPPASSPPVESKPKPSLNINPGTMAAGGALAQAAQSLTRGNVKGALANIMNAGQSYSQHKYSVGTPYTGGLPGSSFNAPVFNQISSGGGHGSLSAAREAQENQIMRSLPTAPHAVVNPNADETQALGLESFERKAFGPPKLIRIKVPLVFN